MKTLLLIACFKFLRSEPVPRTDQTFTSNLSAHQTASLPAAKTARGNQGLYKSQKKLFVTRQGATFNVSF